MERQESERTKRNRVLQSIISLLIKLLCRNKNSEKSNIEKGKAHLETPPKVLRSRIIS